MPLHHSFWIIGETTLAIRCAEILVERGHVVRGLVTVNPTAAGWARDRGLPVVPFRDALPALASSRYDFLLSIVNSRILGADILATPTRGAINYHDGPLPRYAGMHSTSWAILNEERTHGVTWHGIAELVDAGPIFRQHIVPIDPAESALSLNAKSYEAALDAFAELVDDISAGRLEAHDQDLSQRTYFPHLARPPAAGLIDWTRTASAISALVRGLDFGAAYANPLGRPKIRCGAGIYICSRLRVTPRRADAPPGTVVALDSSGITVTSRDHEVVVEAVATLDGTPLELGDLIRDESLGAGRLLGPTPGAVRDRITDRNGELAAHEGYWLRALRRVRPLDIPFRRSAGSPTGRFHQARIATGNLHRALPERERGIGGEVSAIVAAFAALLARLTSEDAISLGFAHPALRPDLDELRQLLAPAVPIEVAAGREASFGALATQVAARLAEAHARETFVRDLPARHPELARGSVWPTALVRLEPAFPPEREYQAELILDIASGGGTALLHADAGVLSGEDTARLAHQLETFLAAVAADPGIPVGQVPIVPEEERALLLTAWNSTAGTYPRDATVHSLFEARARTVPGEPAVIAGGASLTFTELNERADRLADELRSHGVGRDSIVGLRTGRSPELVVGLLAILKAGGAYLPLDLSMPATRTQFMLDDAGVAVVVTTLALRDELDVGSRTMICVDAVSSAAVSPAAARPGADAESLAYVIYTSGSTGKPKGVLVHHRGVVNYLWWAMRYYQAETGTGSPVHSPVAFDLTVTSLLTPLLAGRPVILLDERLGVDALSDSLRESRDLTLVKLTPSHLEVLRHQLAASEAAGRTRAFVIGGENLQGPTLAFWQQHAPGTRLINEYGPTETVVGCSVYEVPPGAVATGPVPIGRPIANTRFYVLDPGGQLLPVGVPGELFVGGDGVARGYLNRPDLTADRFVPDPFQAGGRLYRTGDRVRYLPDGNLEFLGRLDGQVKIRGYRIELGEIESTIASHPDVAEAAATVWHDPVAGARLIGYVRPRGSTTPSPDDLRGWCAGFLPEYMVPAGFELVAGLPLTGNGKLDRSALPAPTLRMTALVEPRSALEGTLAAIWSELLGRPVGVTDNFFDLGGHSLLAVQMISRVRDATGYAPPLSVLLTQPTVEHVAAALEGRNLAVDDDPLILRVKDGDAAPPFFFLHGDFGGSGFYVQTIARHLDPLQAMYSLRPYRPGGPETIAEMAAANLALVRAVQPRGPYLLGGNCNGGAVAYEMARVLRAQGEEVALLALVNTAHRNAHLEPVRRIAELVARRRDLDRAGERAFYLRLRDSVLRTIEQRPYGAIDTPAPRRAAWWAGVAIRTVTRVLRRILTIRVARLLGGVPPAEDALPSEVKDDLGISIAESDEARRARYHYIDAAMREYVAAPSDLAVTLLWWGLAGSFRAEPALHGNDVTRGWSSLCRSVDVAMFEDTAGLAPDARLELLARALAGHVRAARSALGSASLPPTDG